MVKTAIKRRKDIGDLINGHALVILDETSEIKVEEESVLTRLVEMYKKVEKDYKKDKQIDSKILFCDFWNKVVSADDIFKYSNALTDYLSELVINTFLFDKTIEMLVQKSYNEGNNGFTLATNNNPKVYLSLGDLYGVKKNLLQIKFNGDIGDMNNKYNIYTNEFLMHSSYLDIEIHGQLRNIIGVGQFYKLQSSKIKIYGNVYCDQFGEMASDSQFEFYKDVFSDNICDQSNRCTFVFYESLKTKKIGGKNSIVKTNNEKILAELFDIVAKNFPTKDSQDISSQNKIYFINPDGTEKLIAYVNDKGKMVENK